MKTFELWTASEAELKKIVRHLNDSADEAWGESLNWTKTARGRATTVETLEMAVELASMLLDVVEDEDEVEVRIADKK